MNDQAIVGSVLEGRNIAQGKIGEMDGGDSNNVSVSYEGGHAAAFCLEPEWLSLVEYGTEKL